jgi:anti-sigma regulatory factor (Ser/Thr protein kinase)
MDVGTANARESGVVLAADGTAPGRARRYVADVLGALAVPGEAAEAALLVTSELVTNAVRYGRADRVRLLIAACSADGVTLTVADSTPYEPLPEAVMAGELDESGRGLALVAALSATWGHRPEPGGGTAVWAELAW